MIVFIIVCVGCGGGGRTGGEEGGLFEEEGGEDDEGDVTEKDGERSVTERREWERRQRTGRGSSKLARRASPASSSHPQLPLRAA
jgi:hypothetical protein